MPRRDAPHHAALVASSAIRTSDGRSIDLHCFELDRLAVADLDSLPGEREEAGRFQVPRAADRFLARRAILRSRIAESNGCDPMKVELVREGRGRPRVTGLPDFEFNTSHSEDSFMIASSREAVLGIDVESERAIPERDSLLQRICHPDERARLDGTGAVSSIRFLELWTRKEAVVKALGLGLKLDPARVSVPVDDGPLPGWRSASVDDPRFETSRIELITPTDLPKGLVCSLAVELGAGGS